MAGDEREPTDDDLTQQRLDVYASRDGRWNPQHGAVEIPAGWEFLPTGDAFLTRTVKSAGIYWTSWRPRSRNRPHRRRLGIWAPAETIRAAERAAEETAARRASSREHAARSRVGAAQADRQELETAVRRFLDFASEHAALAERIAAEASARATVVGSGRVGRTSLLSLEDKAARAARAHIRHRYTSYEDELDLVPVEAWDEEDAYREVKAGAGRAVDDFLAAHRRTGS